MSAKSIMMNIEHVTLIEHTLHLNNNYINKMNMIKPYMIHKTL